MDPDRLPIDFGILRIGLGGHQQPLVSLGNSRPRGGVRIRLLRGSLTLLEIVEIQRGLVTLGILLDGLPGQVIADAQIQIEQTRTISPQENDCVLKETRAVAPAFQNRLGLFDSRAFSFS